MHFSSIPEVRFATPYWLPAPNLPGGDAGHLEYRKECGYEYEYDLRIEWGIGNVGSCAVAFPSTHFRRPNVAGPGGGWENAACDACEPTA